MIDNHEDLTWFAPVGTPLRSELLRLAALRERLGSRCDGTYRLKKVSNRQYNELIHAHFVDGDVEKTLFNQGLSPLAARAYLHHLCAIPAFYRHLMMRSDLTVCALLDGSLSEIKGGRIIPAFLCLRSIIEHVAHSFQGLRAESLKIDSTCNAKVVAEQLIKIDVSLHKTAYPMRVGLKRILLGEGSLRSQKKLKYTPDDGRIDFTAKSILSAIDKLESWVVGARNIYDVLCEFAHPNAGARFAVAEEYAHEAEVDSLGVIWRSLDIGPGKPVSFAREFGDAIQEILACVADCVEEMVLIGENAAAIESELTRGTQVVASKWIDRFRSIYQPYESCPCRSGKKLKFCCGAKH